MGEFDADTKFEGAGEYREGGKDAIEAARLEGAKAILDRLSKEAYEVLIGQQVEAMKTDRGFLAALLLREQEEGVRYDFPKNKPVEPSDPISVNGQETTVGNVMGLPNTETSTDQTDTSGNDPLNS